MSLRKIALALLVLMSLAACSLSASNPTETPSPTATLELFTQTPVIITATPSITASPSPTATRQTTGGNSNPPPACSYNLSFVADMSLPDGTQVQTGTNIVKTWRVRNSGNCAWGNGFTFRQVDGTAMTATTVNSPSVAVGQTVDIAVTLNVGTNIAAYRPLERANFRMYDNQGRAFGDTLYAELAIVAPQQSCSNSAAIVTAPTAGTMIKGQVQSISWTLRNTGTCTWQNYRIERLGSGSPVLANNAPLTLPSTAPNQTVTFTIQAQLADSATGSGTVQLPLILLTNTGIGFGTSMIYEASYNINAGCSNDAAVVTSPANGNLSLGQSQSVSWTIRNTGTCTWQNYRVESGGIVSTLLALNTPLALNNVAPNQTVTFSINVQLASTTTGSGTASLPLMLRTDTGTTFGPSLDYQASYTVGNNCNLDSDFVADVTMPDGTAVRAGEAFTKTWRIRNSGNCAWEAGYRLVMIDASNVYRWASSDNFVLLPRVEAGATVDISAPLMLIPETATGTTVRAIFRIQDLNAVLFGTSPYVEVLVNNN